VNFFARSHTVSVNKGLTHLRICVNANVCIIGRTHERGNRLRVLRSLPGLPGQCC